MRVLQAMAGAPMGGAEAFFERLVAALARAGVRQRAVIRPHPPRLAALAAAGVEVAPLRFGGPLDLASRIGFRRQVADFAPDLVLTWMNRATRFCPRGRFVHAARLGGYYDLKYYRRCDHLVANTRDIADYLRRAGVPADRVHYLPNFVDARPAPPLPRASLATPDDAPLLLGLGRLHPNKGFDVLLAALAELPKAYLWLAGEGPLRGMLESEARRLGVAGRVRFLGWRDDVPALLAACDVFVCPSRHEPLGNVVLEAWAHRRPVVAAASSGPAALLTDGVNGLLAPVDDAQALAAAVRRVVESPALGVALAEAGREAFARDFTEEAVVARYREFFQRVARV